MRHDFRIAYLAANFSYGKNFNFKITAVSSLVKQTPGLCLMVDLPVTG
ncbi:MAG: hypothetical protein JST01_16755 [Cyanobacteria bacterium SZAS TMP-1]|nr:hypothetical protein [Cyanobacteria bacterium SZAS TMP-1]